MSDERPRQPPVPAPGDGVPDPTSSGAVHQHWHEQVLGRLQHPEQPAQPAHGAASAPTPLSATSVAEPDGAGSARRARPAQPVVPLPAATSPSRLPEPGAQPPDEFLAAPPTGSVRGADVRAAEVGPGAATEARRRRLARRPAQPRALHWLLNLRGLVGGDATPTWLTEAWRGVQTPVPTGRRVLVVSSHGGAGATTVAVTLTQVLRAHRRDGVALVQTGTGRGGVVGRVPQVVSDLATARRGLQQLAQRQWQELVIAPGSDDPRDVLEVSTELRRRFAFTVLDAGAELTAHLGHVDAVVLVGDATVRGVDALQECRRILLSRGVPEDRVLSVVTGVAGDPGTSLRSAVSALRGLGHRAHPVGWDRHLAGAAEIRLELLARRTTLQVSQLTGEVVAAAAGVGTGER